MSTRTIFPDDLDRLKAEREEADRRYNDMLTALDRALPHPPAPLPGIPAGDDEMVAALNERWVIVPGEPLAGLSGWRARLGGLVWRLVGPMVQRQQAFNAALVEHVNRSLPAERDRRATTLGALGLLHDQVAGLTAFGSSLIAYLQQVTPYLDTKDREVAGLMRRINEDVAESCDLLTHRTVGLAAGLSGLGDEMLKRWESIAARQERNEHQMTVQDADVKQALGEFQTKTNVLQQAVLTLKREMERVLASPPTAPRQADGARPEPALPGTAAPAPPRPHEFGSELDSYKYLGFEDQFRGSQDEIRGRMAEYLPIFAGTSDVLDVGCGRGEFLDLLREQGIAARGVDVNREMVEVCRARGLDVVEADALAHLLGAKDGCYGGLFAAQVIEHLEPSVLVRLLETAYHKLRPGAPIVLETINAASWAAFFEAYIRDLTHVRPLHPDTLRYLLQASGFQNVQIRYSAPYPEHARLARFGIPPPGPADSTDARALADLADTCNANVARLNDLLFGYRDYATIGVR